MVLSIYRRHASDTIRIPLGTYRCRMTSLYGCDEGTGLARTSYSLWFGSFLAMANTDLWATTLDGGLNQDKKDLWKPTKKTTNKNTKNVGTRYLEVGR